MIDLKRFHMFGLAVWYCNSTVVASSKIESNKINSIGLYVDDCILFFQDSKVKNLSQAQMRHQDQQPIHFLNLDMNFLDMKKKPIRNESQEVFLLTLTPDGPKWSKCQQTE